MKLYLDSKRISILFLPFLIWGGVFFFNSEIKEDLKYRFFKNEKPVNVQINENIARKYLLLSKAINKNELLEKNDKDEKKIAEKIFVPKKNSTIQKNLKSGWILKYTIISNGEKRAFINGKILKIGEKIDGAILLDIRKNRVKIKTSEGVKWINILEQ